MIKLVLIAGTGDFVETILPFFEKIPKGGLITLEIATIVLHKSGSKKGFFST